MPPQDSITRIVPGGLPPRGGSLPTITPADDPDWEWTPDFLRRAGEAPPMSIDDGRAPVMPTERTERPTATLPVDRGAAYEVTPAQDADTPAPVQAPPPRRVPAPRIAPEPARMGAETQPMADAERGVIPFLTTGASLMPPRDPITRIVPGGLPPRGGSLPTITPADDPDWEWTPDFLRRAGEAPRAPVAQPRQADTPSDGAIVADDLESQMRQLRELGLTDREIRARLAGTPEALGGSSASDGAIVADDLESRMRQLRELGLTDREIRARLPGTPEALGGPSDGAIVADHLESQVRQLRELGLTDQEIRARLAGTPEALGGSSAERAPPLLDPYRSQIQREADEANRLMRESVERRRAERAAAEGAAPGSLGMAPGRPGRPGGPSVPGTVSLPQEQPPIDEAALAGDVAYDRRVESPYDRARRLIDDRRRLEQQQAEVQGGAAADVAGILAADRQRQAETEQLRQRAAAEARGAYQRALDRIDRRAFFTEAGPGGQIGSILAVAMGAIGAEITGGPNMALEMIERQIDQFLDNARTRADGAGQMVDMIDQEFGNRRAADSAIRASLLEEAQAELAMQTAGLQSQEAQIRAQELMLQLEQQRAAAQAQALRDEETHRAETYRTWMQGRRYAAQAADQERRTAMRGMGGGRRGPTLGPTLDAATLRVIAEQRGLGTSDELLAANFGVPIEVIRGVGARTDTRGSASVETLAVAGPLAADVAQQRADGDIHGVGPIEGMLPDLVVEGVDWMTGRSGARMRQRYAQAVTAWRHAMFGATLTPAERAAADQATGGSFWSERAFAEGLDFLAASARRHGRSVPEIDALAAQYAAEASGDDLGITPAED